MYVARLALAAAPALLVLAGQAPVLFLMLAPAIYAAPRLWRASLASWAALEAKVGEHAADLARASRGTGSRSCRTSRSASASRTSSSTSPTTIP